MGDYKKMAKFCVEQLPFENRVKSKLCEMVKLILKCEIMCERIVLFGSYARMEQTVHSDLDILVLSHKEVSREVRGELCSIFEEMGADLLFYTERAFCDSETFLASIILSEGILLWKN